MRRGAPRARPGGATKQLLGSARGYLALEDGLTAEPAWAAEAPQAPSTGTRFGRPACGRSAWWPRRSGCRPRLRQPVHVHGQRPAPSVEASDQCPRVPVHAIGVQCPVRASERPGVRCPASDVRCGRPVSVRSASAVSGRSEVMQRGGGAGRRTAGMAGVGVVARCVHDRLVVCPSRSLALEAGAGGAGPAEVSVLDLAVVVGGGGAVALVDRVADQDRPGAREDRLSVGSRCTARFASCGRLRGTSHFHHCCSEPAQDRAPAPRRRTRHRVRQGSKGAERRLSSDWRVATTLRGHRVA